MLAIGSCPSGWYGYSSNCYYVSTATVVISTAQATCADMGAGLASISDANENNFITNLTTST